MSWLFGYYGNTDQKKIASPEGPFYSFKDSNVVLFAGGNKLTCFFKTKSSNSFWALNGVGLKPIGEAYKIFDENDWGFELTSSQNNIKDVNGHFVALKYSGDELKIFTDELGLREIYIIQLPDGCGITTRIDWIKYFVKPDIDLKEFGSRWLLQNQISRKSTIKNVIRLVCDNATIKNNSVSVEQNIWQPNFERISNPEEFESILKRLLSF